MLLTFAFLSRFAIGAEGPDLDEDPEQWREEMAVAVADRPFRRAHDTDAVGFALPLSADYVYKGDLAAGIERLQSMRKMLDGQPVKDRRLAGGLAIMLWADGQHGEAIRHADVYKELGREHASGWWDIADWMRLLDGQWSELAEHHRRLPDPEGSKAAFHLNRILYHALIEDRSVVEQTVADHLAAERKRGWGGAIWSALLLGDIDWALQLCDEGGLPFERTKILAQQLRFDEAFEVLDGEERTLGSAIVGYELLNELGEPKRADAYLAGIPTRIFEDAGAITRIIKWEMKHRSAVEIVDAVYKHGGENVIRLLKDQLRSDQHQIYFNWMKFLPQELENRERLTEVLAFARGELDPTVARGLAEHILAQLDSVHPNFRAVLHLACGEFEEAWALRLPKEVRTQLKEGHWSLALAGLEAMEDRGDYPLRVRNLYDRALAEAQLGIANSTDAPEIDLRRSLLMSRDLFRYLAERSDIMASEFEEIFAVRRQVMPSYHETVLLERHAEWLEARSRYREAACYRAGLLKVKDTPKNVWAKSTMEQVCRLHETIGRAALAEGDLDEATRRVELCHRVFPASTALAVDVLPLLASSDQRSKAVSLAAKLLTPLESAATQYPNANHLVRAHADLAEAVRPFYNPRLRAQIRLAFVIVGSGLSVLGMLLTRSRERHIRRAGWGLLCLGVTVFVSALLIFLTTVVGEVAYAVIMVLITAIGISTVVTLILATRARMRRKLAD